jgi:hypothetical protein
MYRTQISFVILTLVFCSLGCGGNKQSLSGTVTFSDGSGPLTTGIVCFEGEDGKTGRGIIDSSGKYIVGFDSHKDGIPKGNYKVTLTNTAQEEGTDKDGMPIMREVIDRKYSSRGTSGLEFTADGSKKVFDISVDKIK